MTSILESYISHIVLPYTTHRSRTVSIYGSLFTLPILYLLTLLILHLLTLLKHLFTTELDPVLPVHRLLFRGRIRPPYVVRFRTSNEFLTDYMFSPLHCL